MIVYSHIQQEGTIAQDVFVSTSEINRGTKTTVYNKTTYMQADSVGTVEEILSRDKLGIWVAVK